MTLGRLGRLALARQARGDAEPGEPHLSVRAVHQNIGRLDVLVDEAALMRACPRPRPIPMARRRKAPDLHRRAEQPLRAARRRILEHQQTSAVLAHELQRPHRPRAVELVPQFIFVREAIEDGGVGCSAAGRTASTGRRRLRARHPRQKRSSPSSHRTWKRLSPSLLNRKVGFNCRPPV